MKTRKISLQKFLLNVFRMANSGNLNMMDLGEYTTEDSPVYVAQALMHFKSEKGETARLISGDLIAGKHYFYCYNSYVSDTLGIIPDVYLASGETMVELFQINLK